MLMASCSLIVHLTVFNLKVELIFYDVSKVATPLQRWERVYTMLGMDSIPNESQMTQFVDDYVVCIHLKDI